MGKLIYLDNAATTKTSPTVVEAMLPYFTEYYGNPSSVYEYRQQQSKEAITKSRETHRSDAWRKAGARFTFTAGGSESDNWALKATAEAYASQGKAYHHDKDRASCHPAYVRISGEAAAIRSTYLDVDENGMVKLDELERAIRPDTILISVMFANNEIGTIQPIKEIGEIAHEHGILFHTDAVQAFGQVPIDVDECHIDMLSCQRPQAERPEGHRLPIHPQGCEDPFLHSWRRTGAQAPCRHRERAGHRRLWQGSRACICHYGRAYRKRRQSSETT